jgi:CubicO group peptidase (beta-lactamase class C family)
MKTARILIVYIIVFSLLASCTAAQPAAVPDTESQLTAAALANWQTSSPADQGLDEARLDDMTAYIKERDIPVHSMLILRNGYLVYESYFDPYTASSLYEVFSITKSLTSILVGLAIEDGFIQGVEVPISTYLPAGAFPAEDPRVKDITIEHLLTMTSGLGWLEERKYFNELYDQQDWVEYLLGLPLEEIPGTVFYYCSGCTHLLAVVLENAVSEPLLDYAQHRLFEPLGIQNYTWEADPAGVPIGGWGLSLQARDMAKLGQLFLQNGIWEGEQVVPGDWVQKSVSLQVVTGGELDYGYLWWIHPRFGSYAALGRSGQTLMVIPEHKLVMVFTANQRPPIPYLIEYFILPSVNDN